jgi:hypothetical protein
MVSMLVIGSILIASLVKGERRERELRAKAEPVMST